MPEVQLLISFGQDGIKVQGPIADQVLCYGLLELAKDAIRAHAENAKRIVQPAAALVRPVLVPTNGRG